jgi:hypothetical protein
MHICMVGLILFIFTFCVVLYLHVPFCACVLCDVAQVIA